MINKNSINSRCYIVGAGDNSGTDFIKDPFDFVIGVDGGIRVLMEKGIDIDLRLGDFDSLGYVPDGDNVIRYEVEKDDTDMMLAVKYALEKNFKNICLFGGTGGRIDHTFANIQTMLYASRKGADVTMEDSEYLYMVITDKGITIKGEKGKKFSLFCLGGRVRNLTVKGGRYDGNFVNLTEDNTICVSNEFELDPVEIRATGGSVLAVIEK